MTWLRVHDHEVTVIEGIVDAAQKTLALKKGNPRKRKSKAADDDESSESSLPYDADVPHPKARLTGKAPALQPKKAP